MRDFRELSPLIPSPSFSTHTETYGLCDSTLTGNIRSRRGAKVAINVPIFKDVNTPSPFIDPTIPWDRTRYPGDAGEYIPTWSLQSKADTSLFTRGQKWCCQAGSYLYGCHGVWDGMLLPSNHISSVER